MDDEDDTPRPPPARWVESLKRAEEDLAAGRTVPLDAVLRRMEESLQRLRARSPLPGEAAPPLD